MKLKDYRRHADRVWLLLVCDLWPDSANFEIPREACRWCLTHAFDKVILVSRGDGEVLTF